jgi:hypothetical protein
MTRETRARAQIVNRFFIALSLFFLSLKKEPQISFYSLMLLGLRGANRLVFWRTSLALRWLRVGEKQDDGNKLPGIVRRDKISLDYYPGVIQLKLKPLLFSVSKIKIE